MQPGGQVAPGEKGGRERGSGSGTEHGPEAQGALGATGRAERRTAGRAGQGRQASAHPSIPACIHPSRGASIHRGGAARGERAATGLMRARGGRCEAIVFLASPASSSSAAVLLLCCAALLPSSLHSSHGRGSLFRHQHLGPRGQDIRGLRWRRLRHHEARVSQGKSTDPSQALGYGILGETGGC